MSATDLQKLKEHIQAVINTYDEAIEVSIYWEDEEEVYVFNDEARSRYINPEYKLGENV